jgi:feruloyl esterase
MPLAAAALALALAAAGDCAALAEAPLAGGRVVSAQAADGACRITVELSPTPRSRIGAQVWLPLTGWNGRYVQLGTGGFAGVIPTASLAAEVARGRAVGVTDSGHVGEDNFDARWAVGNSEAVIDYGHRSIKATSDAARELVGRFYGRPAAWRYFIGCSNGGRQALMAAQRYPQDWDGILAGAPALAWTEQLSSHARIAQALRRPGGMIPIAKLPAIQAAARAGRAMRTCAPGRDGDGCLTLPQQAALAAIARDFDPAYAATPGGWDAWLLNPDRSAKTTATLAEQFFRHMVLARPDWRVEDLTAADLRAARRLAPILDATDPDLSRFRALGGKLVMYAGAADPVISPRPARAYYAALGRTDFARLFVIPGMLHCQGGPEPHAFGQSPASPPLTADPDHDIQLALEAWVEAGRAPKTITAVKYVDDDPAKGVAAARRVRAEQAASRSPQREARPARPPGR